MSAAAPAVVPRLSVKDLSVTYVGRSGEKTEAVRDVSFAVSCVAAVTPCCENG